MNATLEHVITFLPGGRTEKGNYGESLMDVARRAGLHLNSSCGGDGVCGKCRVIVESGIVSEGSNQ